MSSPSIEADFHQLWTRCKAGDREAQRELFERYEEDLLRCIRVHLRDPALRRITDSTDLCLTVARRLIAGIERYDFASYGGFQGLVSKIVQSRVDKIRAKLINQRRAEQRAAEQRDQLLVSTDPTRPLELREVHEFVQGKLSKGEWKLFEAATLHGKSYVELAGNEGVSADAIRKRIARMKAFVREQMETDQ